MEFSSDNITIVQTMTLIVKETLGNTWESPRCRKMQGE
jgi:hypothetical protein